MKFRNILVTTIVAAAAGLTATAQPCDPIEVDKLVATGGFPLEEMGTSIAVDGDVMATGATDIGAVYVFRKTGGGAWVQEARLTPTGASADSGFGGSVAVFDDVVVVGASLDFGTGTDSGAVYVFRNTTGSTWVQESRLTQANAGFNDSFGYAVAARNGRILAGAPGDNIGVAFAAGSVRVFEENAGSGGWDEAATLTAGTPESGATFGFAVAMDGSPGDEVAVIGAPSATTPQGAQAGRAYLFRHDPGPLQFVEQGQFPQPSVFDDGRFGGVVDVSGDAAVIGLPGASRVSIYRFSPVSIALEKTHLVSIPDSDFPSSVAIDGDLMWAGLPGYEMDTGAMLGMTFNDGEWVQNFAHFASNGGTGDRFGTAVALQGEEAFFGAPFEDDNGLDAGAVYVIDTNCEPDCLADVNGDGMVTPTDFTAWINAFNNNLPECDQNGDGMCTPTDFTAWINNFNAGC